MRRNLIYPLLIYGLLSVFQESNAQTTTRATGKVISNDGVAIPGATIDVLDTKSNKKQTFGTDEEGMFTLTGLSTEGNYNIYVHHVGYQRDSVMHFVAKTGQTNTILVRLAVDDTHIDEVVVIGYGSVQKKDLTGAISSVDGKDISARKTTQLSQALQGSVPGVMVTRNNGAPGASATV